MGTVQLILTDDESATVAAALMAAATNSPDRRFQNLAAKIIQQVRAQMEQSDGAAVQ